jgi:hypothetical protein
MARFPLGLPWVPPCEVPDISQGRSSDAPSESEQYDRKERMMHTVSSRARCDASPFRPTVSVSRKSLFLTGSIFMDAGIPEISAE